MELSHAVNMRDYFTRRSLLQAVLRQRVGLPRNTSNFLEPCLLV